MDKILLGIAASTHTDCVKKSFIKKVIQAANRPAPDEVVLSVLQISTTWMIEDDSALLQDLGRQLLHAWVVHNPAVFEDFFHRCFLTGIPSTETTHPEKTVRFIHDGLELIGDRAASTKLIQARVVPLLKMHTDLQTLVELGRLLVAFPECLPRGAAAGLVCIAVVANVGGLSVAPTEAAMRANLEGMVHVGALLQHIWHEDVATVVPALAAIFKLISATPSPDVPSPSVALGALVQHVPVDLIAMVTKNATSDLSIVDERITAALSRMIDWLSWPRVKNIDRWIVSFLKNLALAQKFTVLINVTLASVKKVVMKLCFPIVRDSALPVLVHMLLSFQHSPEAFHMVLVVVAFPELMQRLRTENSESSQDCLVKVTKLVYCLMYQHAGYPDLYEPVLEALKGLPRPSEEDMKEALKMSAWTSRVTTNPGLTSYFLPRSETGKTGLVNLGNTCYMNSVLQALFMTSGFVEEIMACPVYNDESVLARLQRTFAFLTHTQRAAYSPKEILSVSRPPWFTTGTQQDCSEFLKYLLDRLEEEEKSVRRFDARLQKTREKVDRMKKKNAKKKEMEETARRRQQGGDDPAMAEAETPTDRCGLDAGTAVTLERPSRTLCDGGVEKGHGLLEMNVNNDVEGHPSTNRRCDVVETAPKSTDMDTSAVLFNPHGQSSKGHPVCSPSGVDTELESAGATEQSGTITCRVKLPDAEPSSSDQAIGPTIVEKYFAGKSLTTIRCLTCNSVSSRTETFVDIPLAFPGSDTTSSMRGGESCASKDASKSLALGPDRLAQEAIASGSKQWEVGGGAAASTSAVKDFVSGVGSGGEGHVDPTGSSLEELLLHYLNPELLTGDNQYHCDKCRCLRDAEKHIEIAKAPKILVLTLMRFSYDVKTQRRCKILADVKFPKILNLVLRSKDLLPDADKDEPNESEEADTSQDAPCTKRLRQNSDELNTTSGRADYKFALYGVTVHSGLSSESGHYYAYARHARFSAKSPKTPPSEQEAGDNRSEEESDLLTDQWFLFNDSRVSFSSYDSFGNVTKRFPKDTAYVLFYRQVPASPANSSTDLRDTPLKKELQEAISKDNSLYLKERELEARTRARWTSRGPESSSNHHNFDDRNDPPGGCGGGGGGMSRPRLVF